MLKGFALLLNNADATAEAASPLRPAALDVMSGPARAVEVYRLMLNSLLYPLDILILLQLRLASQAYRYSFV